MVKLSFRAKYLMMYLLTSPHRNILCYYFLPKPYACFDLGFSEDEFDSAMQELTSIESVFYDEKANVVFVKNYLKYNPLENQNQVKSAISRIGEIPENLLLETVIKTIKQLGKAVYEPLIKLFVERLHKGLGKGLDKPLDDSSVNGLPNQITDNSIQITDNKTDDDDDNACTCDNTKQDELSRVYQCFSSNIHPVSGEIEAERLADLVERYSGEWVLEAIKETAEYHGRTVKYVENILLDWDKRGFKAPKENGGKTYGSGPGEKANQSRDSGIIKAGYGKGKKRSETDWSQEKPGWD